MSGDGGETGATASHRRPVTPVSAIAKGESCELAALGTDQRDMARDQDTRLVRLRRREVS